MPTSYLYVVMPAAMMVKLALTRVGGDDDFRFIKRDVCDQIECVSKGDCTDNEFPCPLWGVQPLCCQKHDEVCSVQGSKFSCECANRKKRLVGILNLNMLLFLGKKFTEKSQFSCGSHCTNIWDDRRNCGDCGTSCKKSEVCHEAQCSQWANT